jgi:hypothetical protein
MDKYLSFPGISVAFKRSHMKMPFFIIEVPFKRSQMKLGNLQQYPFFLKKEKQFSKLYMNKSR